MKKVIISLVTGIIIGVSATLLLPETGKKYENGFNKCLDDISNFIDNHKIETKKDVNLNEWTEVIE